MGFHIHQSIAENQAAESPMIRSVLDAQLYSNLLVNSLCAVLFFFRDVPDKIIRKCSVNGKRQHGQD